MTKPARQGNDTLIEILELSQNEVELIKSIRTKWRFGEIRIHVRDGSPYRLVRVEEFIDLTQHNK